MAGLAAAVGGFAQGLGQGLKLRSDLDDAESKRQYMGLQTQKLQQEVDTEKQFGELQKSMAEEIQNYTKGTGVYAPAEGQSYDPLNPQTIDTYYNRLGAMATQQAILAKKNPLEVEENMNKLRKEKFGERVMQASQRLSMGDASGLDLIKPQFKQLFGGDLKDATYDQNTDSFNINYVGKDGQEGTRTIKRQAFSEGLLPMALNPADAAKFMMQNKELAQQKELKERELTGIENYRTESLKIEQLKAENVGSHYKAMEGYYKQLGSAAIINATTNRDAVNQQKIASALSTDLNQISVLSGLQKNFKPETATDEQVKEQKLALNRTNLGMNIYTMNIKDGKPQITPDQAVAAANGNPNNYTFRDGRTYFKLGDKEIFVPISQDQAAALGVPGAKPADKPGAAAPAATPAASAPNRGIRAPGAVPNRDAEAIGAEAEQVGQQLDAARARLTAATNTVRQFGLRQRQTNPEGFAAAQTDLAKAQAEVSQLEQDYQNSLPRGLRGVGQ